MPTLLRRAVLLSMLPLLPESRTSERLCQIKDVSEDILCISKDIISLKAKDIVSLKAKFTPGLHKILHRGQQSPTDYFGSFLTEKYRG